MSTLNACPSCRIVPSLTQSGIASYRFECSTCGIATPWKTAQTVAVAAWNSLVDEYQKIHTRNDQPTTMDAINCPRCGQAPEIIKFGCFGVLFKVGCDKCKIYTDSSKTIDGAIAAWNNFKIDTTHYRKYAMQNNTSAPVTTTPITPDPMADQVGGNHYKDLAIQPVEYIERNKIPFIEGSVIKYVTRHANKNGAQDIEKAIHFLEMLLKLRYPNHKRTNQ